MNNNQQPNETAWYILKIMGTGVATFCVMVFIYVELPKILKGGLIQAESQQQQTTVEAPKTYLTNAEDINIESCKNLTDENTKPCADFANKCYERGKIVEQWDIASALTDPDFVECQRKGWNYNNKY